MIFFDDSYGRALKFKNGCPVKYFNITKNFKVLDLIDEDGDKYKKIKQFLVRNQFVYFIPCEIPGNEIVSFVLRARGKKEFRNVKLNEKYPMVFGLEDFYDYVGQTILLTEGVKDAMFLKRFYKYSLAYLTSQPQKDLWEYLKRISRNILFFPDNDMTGRNIKKLKKYADCKVYYGKEKDWGKYWEDISEERKQDLIESLNVFLKYEKVISIAKSKKIYV